MNEITLATNYLAAWLEYFAKQEQFNSLIRNDAPTETAIDELEAAREVLDSHRAAIIAHGQNFAVATKGYTIVAVPEIKLVEVKPVQ